MNKRPLPFDKRGGLIAIRVPMLKSNAYRSLTAQAKVLLTLMHLHWKNDKPVDYGIREALRNIPCAFNTALRAFDQLIERGFVVNVEESAFNSRTGSKTRSWRLTWMPYMDAEPTNEWEKWRKEN